MGPVVSVSRSKQCSSRRAAAFAVLALCFAAAIPDAADAAGASQVADGLHISTGAVIAPDGTRGCPTTTRGSAASRRPRTRTAATSSTRSAPVTPGRARASAACCPTPAPAPTPPASPPSSTRRPSSRGPATSSRSSPTARRPARRSSGRAGTATPTASSSRTRSHLGARTRPTAVSIGPDGNAYVAFQRQDDVQQITDVDGASPTVRIVALTTDGRAASRSRPAATLRVASPCTSPRGRASSASSSPARDAGRTTPGRDRPGQRQRARLRPRAQPALRRHRQRVNQADAGIDAVHRIDVTRRPRSSRPATAPASPWSAASASGPRASCSWSTIPPCSTRPSRSAPAACSASACRRRTSPEPPPRTTAPRRSPSPATARSSAFCGGPARAAGGPRARPTAASLRRPTRRRRLHPLGPRGPGRGHRHPEAHRFVVDTVAPAIPVIDRPAQGAAAPLRPGSPSKPRRARRSRAASTTRPTSPPAPPAAPAPSPRTARTR